MLDNHWKLKNFILKELIIEKDVFNKYIENDFKGKEFELLLERYDLNHEKIIFQKQVHSDNIKVVDREFLKKRKIVRDNDALITNNKNLFLCAYTADCVPVSFFDLNSQALGIAHSGWKGALNCIARKTALTMNRVFTTKLQNLKCYLGPSIKSCCYEVGGAEDNRVQDFRDSFGERVISKSSDSIYLDLHEAIKMQLIEIGVREENIKLSSRCTCCDKKNPPSYYRDGKEYKNTTLSIIGINK